jgi:Mrp family chromosome partitioning ATPase/capsular polysaccharide biosynthesis protein
MIPNLVFVLRRRWPILIAIPVLAIVATLVIAPESAKQTPRYTSTVYVGGEAGKISSIDLVQDALRIKQSNVAEAAAKSMGEEITDPKEFATQLKVKNDTASLTIKISTVDTNRIRAREYPLAFAEAFVAADEARLNEDYVAQRQRLDAQLAAADKAVQDFITANIAKLSTDPPDPGALRTETVLEDRAGAIQTRINTLEDNRAETAYSVRAQDPVTRVAPAKLQLPSSKPLRAVLAALLGLLGAVALTALLEKLNPRIDNPKRAEAIVGAPVLAQVPIMKGKRAKLVDRADLDLFTGPFAESFRAMRSHLDFRSSAEDMERPPCVMVVSSAPAEGKTTTAAFLGLSYAEVGRDVVVVGADFRRPAIHRLFGVSRTPGLSSRLLGDNPNVTPDEVVNTIVKRDDRTGVRVIPSGPGTDRVTGLLGDLSVVTKAGLQSGCTVLIDTAPVMVANDAIDFLPLVDWVVVVVRLGRSTERSLRQTIQNLELNEARVAGCVLMGSLESSDAKRYYYSYYRSGNETRSTTEQHLRAARERREADVVRAQRDGNGSGGRPSSPSESVPRS